MATNELSAELAALRRLMAIVDGNFNEATEPASIDALIYERLSVMKRLGALIASAKLPLRAKGG